MQSDTSTESLVLGVSGGDDDGGGRVQVWSLQHKPRTVHKLLSSVNTGVRARNTPEWVMSDECSVSAGLVSLSTPCCSLDKSCYIALAYNDGSVQLLAREGLTQVASVDLPRSGNNVWSGVVTSTLSHSPVTITQLCFTSTSSCLVAADSLGQLYLFRLTDPGNNIVTLLEYCLVTGRDTWDITIASDHTKLESVTEKLSQNFSRQSPGQQQYFNTNFMSLKSSLYRLIPSSQYKAADTTALLMLQSINSAFKGLLRSSDSKFLDFVDPTEKLETTLKTQEDVVEVETIVQTLIKAGVSRDHQQDSPTVQFLSQLSLWVTTLCLHVLAAVPEFKSRKGPGYSLVQVNTHLSLVDTIRCWPLIG